MLLQIYHPYNQLELTQDVYNNNIEKTYVNKDGTVKNFNNDEEYPLTIYLVVVNEGEGFVVDYYSVLFQ